MKNVLITGGSRGVGAEAVKLFAKNGYRVILNYHKSEQQAIELQQRLVAEGCDVHLFSADVGNSLQVSQMFAWIEKYFKHLDVLVNNAGVALSSLCQDVSEHDFDFVMNTNAKGTFLCCQGAIKLFLKQQRGCIVNVASIWGILGAACESVYSMSKHAIVGLTKSLAEELSSSNIRVTCVCPPIVLTEMCSSFSEREIQEFCEQYSVHTYQPQQVAQDILHLAECDQTAIILQER